MENTTSRLPSLNQYHCLGRSGLRVSPLCLGTMTFGTDWGWGSPQETVHKILGRYIEAGGNFIDTADMYTSGKSEEMIGGYFAANGQRDRMVIATKYTFNAFPGDPNAGGNGRKNMLRAVEGSLQRLKTDYIDLFWVHAWDMITPVEEVMSGLNDLVRSGKIRYIGLSDTPAWYLSRAQTLAELRGWDKVAALQLEYSLVERNIEREHIPAAIELGMSVCPWSPLGGGILSGKYARGGTGEGRLQTLKDSGNPVFMKFTDRNFDIVETLVKVSKELGKAPAQVALNWITRRPGVTSTLIGATKLDQLESNLGALEFEIPAGLSRQLDEASRIEPGFPYVFYSVSLCVLLARDAGDGHRGRGSSGRAEVVPLRPFDREVGLHPIRVVGFFGLA
jgi:aryl-alcohol dehydrogenase-like predicted oxidoreductase